MVVGGSSLESSAGASGTVVVTSSVASRASEISFSGGTE